MIPPALTELFSTVAAGSWRAGWLILALVVVRRLVRGRIPAQVWFAVWIVVALRLLLPVSLPAAWSPFNILPAHTAVSGPRLAPAAPMPTPTPAALSAPAASTVRTAIAPTEPASPTPIAVQDNTPPVAAATAAQQSASPLAASAPSTTVQSATTRPANLLEPAAARSIYWTTTEIVTALWLAGVAILALARLIALARFHRRLRTLHATTDARLADTVAREARQLGGTGAPMCFETDAVDAPALFGILRPRLLFPPGLAAQLTDDELRLVVRHELAHWRRRDLLAQTLLQAAAILHWFNPLAWFAARLARNDCELACDEFVLRRETADGSAAYGNTLLKVLGVTPRLRRRPAASVGIFESKQQLAQRVRTIAGYRAATRASLLGGIALVALLATASLTRESRAAAKENVSPAAISTTAQPITAPNAERPQHLAEAVRVYMEKERMVPLDQAIADVQAELKLAREALWEAERRFLEITERREKKQPLAEHTYIASDPRVVDARGAWEKQKAKLAALRGTYTDQSSQVKAALSETEALEQAIERTAEIVSREIHEDRDNKARAYAAVTERLARAKQLMTEYRSVANPSAATYMAAQMQAPATPATTAPTRTTSVAPAATSASPPSAVVTESTTQDRSARINRDLRVADAQRQLQLMEDAYRARHAELMQVQREEDAVVNRLSEIKRQEQAKKPLADLPFVASQPLVIRLQGELMNGRIEGAALRARVPESHPDLAVWEKRMRQIEIELDRTVRAAVEQVETSRRNARYGLDIAAEETDKARAKLLFAEEQLGKLRADAEEAALKTSVAVQAVASAPAREGDFVIRIMGAVNQQGTISFPAGDKPILLDVIAQAGGFAPNADRSAVRLIWPGADGRRESQMLSQEQVADGTKAVPAGSTIIVPERNFAREVSIIGAVNSPGTFPLPEYPELSLASLIAKAGGPTRLGDLRRVRVTRTGGGPSELAIFTLDLSALQGVDTAAAKEGLKFELKRGDVVFVPERIL